MCKQRRQQPAARMGSESATRHQIITYFIASQPVGWVDSEQSTVIKVQLLSLGIRSLAYRQLTAEDSHEQLRWSELRKVWDVGKVREKSKEQARSLYARFPVNYLLGRRSWATRRCRRLLLRSLSTPMCIYCLFIFGPFLDAVE